MLFIFYPDAHFGVGPVIENGFYYDIDVQHSLAPSDLEKIEKMMQRMIKENFPVARKEVTRAEAKQLFQHDPLKLELLDDIAEDEIVSIYEQGEFYDLCRGPHVPATSRIEHFKLMHVSGAYWRGNSDNQMLQRIYGVAFSTKEELQDYFVFLAEAEKRNHRKLGKELELFMFSEESMCNGSIRFSATRFPLWLAPVQVKVIGIAQAHAEYVQQVVQELKDAHIRVIADERNEKLGKKIREAQMKKSPYILVLGNQEQQNATVNVRKYGQSDSFEMTLKQFIANVQQEIINKQLA